MKRCPKCDCGAEFVNRAEFYAKHAGAFIVGVGAGGATSIVSPNHATHAAHQAYENLTKGVYKRYRCTNPKCLHEWYD